MEGEDPRRPRLAVERVSDDVYVLVPSGEPDLAVAGFERTLEELLAAGARRLVIDLSELAFLETASIRTLVETLNRVGAAGVSLVAAEGEPRRVLELTGLDLVFAIHSTRAEALRAAGLEPG